LLDLVNVLEKIFVANIQENYPENYDENHITYCILNEIRKRLAHIEVDSYLGRISMSWRPWKLKGKFEKNFGDIAILVNIRDNDGLEIQGVGFLEAKKRYRESGKFDAVKEDQLSRIYENAPYSMLLFYDFQLIEDFIKYQSPYTSFPFKLYRHFMRSEPWTELVPPMAEATHSVTIPIHLAKQVGLYDPTLYRYSTPFSTQIIFRYLNGFDLEFSDEPIAIAKGFSQSDDISPPKFLLIVSIGRGGAEPLEDIGINTDFFETFDDKKMMA